MKHLILLFALVCCTAYSPAQTLIARYPLKADGKDALNKNSNLKLLGIKFEGASAKCEGTYGDYDAGKGVAILSQNLEEIDNQNFSVRVDFKVSAMQNMPVFVYGQWCRHFAYNITEAGKVVLAVANGDSRKESTLTYKVNTWHTATVVVLKSGGLVAYLDNIEVARVGKGLDLKCGEDKNISTTNFSNAQVFKGFWRDLRLYNGTWTPQSKDTPPTPIDKPIDKPIENPVLTTTLGTWRTTDFMTTGKPNTDSQSLRRRFFTLKNKAGNLEVVWQDDTDKKVYISRFDAQVQNPQHATLPALTGAELLAVANDAQDNYYLAVFKKVGEADVLTLQKIDRTGKQLAQKAQSSGEKDLNIYSIGRWMATMVCKDDKIALFIARTMNKSSDGLRHQGGIGVLFNANTLEVIKNFGQTSGHSFDNFLAINQNGDFLGMDLGDNYPRGIHVHKFNASSQWIQSKLVYTFKTEHGTTANSPAGANYPKYDEISTPAQTYYKWSNDNGTYTELGNIAEVNDGYLVFFAGEPDAQGKSINNARAGYTPKDSRNLGFVKVRKDFENAKTLKEAILSKGLSEKGGFYTFGGWWSEQQNEGVNWLTKLKNPQTENVKNVKALVLPDGKILLLYAVDSANSWEAGKEGYQPYMMAVDAQGKPTLPATAIDRKVVLSRRDEAILVGKYVVVVQGVAENGSTKLRVSTLELK